MLETRLTPEAKVARRTNAIVTVHEGESAEHALKRLERSLLRNGTYTEMKGRKAFVPRSLRRRIKALRSRKRLRKAEQRRAAHENPDA